MTRLARILRSMFLLLSGFLAASSAWFWATTYEKPAILKFYRHRASPTFFGSDLTPPDLSLFRIFSATSAYGQLALTAGESIIGGYNPGWPGRGRRIPRTDYWVTVDMAWFEEPYSQSLRQAEAERHALSAALASMNTFEPRYRHASPLAGFAALRHVDRLGTPPHLHSARGVHYALMFP
jgi:hypothetical protein